MISVRFLMSYGLFIAYAAYRDDDLIGTVRVHVGEDITAAVIAAGIRADDIALEKARVLPSA